jgi:superfamily II DNA or RNA helicase
VPTKHNADRNRPEPAADPALEVPPPELRFDRGSVLLEGIGGHANVPGFLTWDSRVSAFRCHAFQYRALVQSLRRTGVPYRDAARAYGELELRNAALREPFPHQREALAAWRPTKRGLVELPTGSGKTLLGLMAVAEARRDALVLVPTLELVTQWCLAIERDLGLVPGAIGGGSFEVRPITVSTYASAFRHGDQFGDRFGLAIFDECHHLAGAGFARIAECLIAPFRLGISATLEREDGRHALLEQLVGPVLYRKGIPELSGRYLADYEVRTLYAELSPAEREAYREARERYLGFAREAGIALNSAGDWRRFVFAASRSAAGRAALDAYFLQKRLAFSAEAKFQLCAELLHRHRGQRVLIFTNDNATAYEVARRLLLPIITHQTKVAERREILSRFHDGRWPFLVTSKVLNEGVDVPSASVAVILSGNASVREHVQRLGRILRRQEGKQAVLYEVLTRRTAEESTSLRRRQHDAYR